MADRPKYERWAEFSPCRTWRYTLGRVWNPDKLRMLFIPLNASLADEHRDDPTNRRGINFAVREGYGSVVFVNLFAFRTPYPNELKTAGAPIGPLNDWWILKEARNADKIVLAWGTHGSYMNRDQDVLAMLEAEHCELFCLGQTKRGYPKHPLYLRADTPLQQFRLRPKDATPATADESDSR